MNRALLSLLLLATCALAQAAPPPLRIAVASNFAALARELGQAFGQRHGLEVQVISGSSGKLYAQIIHGAPFELFLSADAERADRLREEGIATLTRTYAIGRLAYWSPGAKAPCRDALFEAQRVAIANPRTAPYGRAAQQVLERLGLTELERVTAENVGQAWAFVHAGAADGGFVARSQLPRSGVDRGCVWEVPEDLHEPIEQRLALLSERPLARLLVEELASAAVARQLRVAGYDLPDRP